MKQNSRKTNVSTFLFQIKQNMRTFLSATKLEKNGRDNGLKFDLLSIGKLNFSLHENNNDYFVSRNGTKKPI